MVLVDNKSQPKAAFQFTAEITLLEEKVAKAIIWEGYEPVVTSQTTHQACTIDFEDVECTEMTEEEIQNFKGDNLNNESVRKSSLTKEFTRTLDIEKKQRSKSEDLREEYFTNKKQLGPSIFKEKLSLIRNKTETSEDEETKGLDIGNEDDLKIKKESLSDSGHSPRHLGISKEGENGQKITFQEKIKMIKKSVFKDVEELVSKRRKRKFIGISSDEKKLLKFKFKYHPEYIIKAQKIIINDSTMKAIGIIKDIFYVDSTN